MTSERDEEFQKAIEEEVDRDTRINSYRCFAKGARWARARKEAEIAVLREALERCLHARQCNAPFGQMEKMPTVNELREALAFPEGKE